MKSFIWCIQFIVVLLRLIFCFFFYWALAAKFHSVQPNRKKLCTRMRKHRARSSFTFHNSQFSDFKQIPLVTHTHETILLRLCICMDRKIHFKGIPISLSTNRKFTICFLYSTIKCFRIEITSFIRTFDFRFMSSVFDGVPNFICRCFFFVLLNFFGCFIRGHFCLY